jgi:hypothetical protein
MEAGMKPRVLKTMVAPVFAVVVGSAAVLLSSACDVRHACAVTRDLAAFSGPSSSLQF